MIFHSVTAHLQSIRRLSFALLLAASPAAGVRPTAAQGAAGAEPRREQLLNGLKLVMLHRPDDPQVFMKLRVPAGASFDLANKEGMMRLLADAMFPDKSTFAYAGEELEGRLEVTTTYDAIDVTLSGRAAAVDQMAEMLRNALVQLRLAPEEVQRLRQERIRQAREQGLTPAAVADRAVAARLYGAHPYGRAPEGTPESLARVERADLLYARDRFLIPNDAVLVMIGGVEPARAYRLFRQFLGPWRRGDAVAPATFRQPAPPDARALVVNVPAAGETAEVRLALRGLALADRDRVAAAVLARVVGERWRASLKDINPVSLSVEHEAHTLSGTFRLSAAVPASASAQTIEAARAVLREVAGSAPTAAEVERARRETGAALRSGKNQTLALADEWLDGATFNVTTAQALKTLEGLTPADVQRVAARLFRDAAAASVVVGDATQLRASLARLTGGVEVSGEQAAPQPAATQGRRPQ